MQSGEIQCQSILLESKYTAKLNCLRLCDITCLALLQIQLSLIYEFYQYLLNERVSDIKAHVNSLKELSMVN